MKFSMNWIVFMAMFFICYSQSFSQKYKWAYIPIPYIQSAADLNQPVLKVDSKGVYKIAFAANQHIMYAEFDGTFWKIEIGGDDSYRDSKVDLALDSKDEPHLLYHQGDYDGIIYANKNNGNWQSEIIARPENIKTDWYQLSIILNDQDEVFTAYTSPNGELAEATLFYSIISTPGQIPPPTPMVPTGRNGKWNDFIIDNQTGLPVLAYFADHVRKPVLARYGDNDWDLELIDSIQVNDSTIFDENLYGYGISLAQKRNGTYVMTHHDAEAGQNAVYLMEGVEGNWKKEIVYTIIHTTWSSENPVSVDSRDSVFVAHNLYDNETKRNDLYLSYRENENWIHELVENNSYAGLYPDLAINKYDRPAISYLDSVANLLYLAIAVDEVPSKEPKAIIDTSAISFNHISDSLKINNIKINCEYVGKLFPLALKKDSTLTRVFLKVFFENENNDLRVYPLKLNPTDTSFTASVNYNLNTRAKIIVEGDDIYRNKFVSDTIIYKLTDTLYYSKVDTTGPDFSEIGFSNLIISDSLLAVGPLNFPESQSKAPVKSVRYNFLRSFENSIDTGSFVWDEDGWTADSIFLGLNNIGLLQILAQDTLGKVTDKWIKICSPWDWPEMNFEDSRWQLVGVPFDIGYKEFKAGLSPSGANHHFYIISDNELKEKKFKDNDSIMAGTGMLYGALNGNWSVESFTQGISNKAVDTLYLKKGWNLITMPFPFEVPASSIQFSREDQIALLLQLRYSSPNYVWQAAGSTFFPYVGYALYSRLDNQYITFDFSPSIPEKPGGLHTYSELLEKNSGQRVYFSESYEPIPYLTPLESDTKLYALNDSSQYLLKQYANNIKERIYLVSKNMDNVNFQWNGSRRFQKVELIDLATGYNVLDSQKHPKASDSYLLLAGTSRFVENEKSGVKATIPYSINKIPNVLNQSLNRIPIQFSKGVESVKLNLTFSDLRGKKISLKNIKVDDSNPYLEFNLGAFPLGVYVMEINDHEHNIKEVLKVIVSE